MALNEFLVSAKFDDVKFGVDDVVVIIEFDDDLPMSLDASNGIDE
jgi:hypothetical protein